MKKFLFLLLFGSPIFLFAQQSWTITPKSDMPEPVSNNAVVEGFIGDTAFVFSFAGIDTTKIYSGIHLRSFKYNTVTDQWHTIAPLPDTLGKVAAGASRVGDTIYIIGGYHVFEDDTELSSNRVHRYDLVNDRYLADGQPIPTAIDDQVQLVWKDSLIYVITGWSDSRNVPLVQIYDPSKDEWMSGTSTPNSRRYRSFGASGTLVGDTIYYFGGASDFSGFSAQEEMRKGVIDPNDPTKIDWSQFTPEPEQTAYRAVATTVNEKAYWIGGSKITYNYDGLAYSNNQGVPTANQVLVFDPTTEQLVAETYDFLPMDLRGIAITGANERYLAGGMLEDQQVGNKTWMLEWQDVSTAIATPLDHNPYFLSPNPAYDQLQIGGGKNTTTIHVQIFDLLGRRYFQHEKLELGQSISLTDLPSGVYLLQLEENGDRQTLRFVKK